MSTASPRLMKKLPLFSLSIGYFIVIADASIVNVVLPTLSHYFHGRISDLAWVIDSYILTSACFLLLAGSLSDRFSPKKLFVAAVIMFILSSLGCAISTGFRSLIFFRLFQGAAGAFIIPTSLALVNVLYKDPIQLAKAIGVWTCIGGIAAALGPFLGGLLTALASWRAIFFINLPACLIALGLIHWFANIDKKRKASNQESMSLDLPGQLMGTLSAILLAFALIKIGNWGWDSWGVARSFLGFFIVFALFLTLEAKVSSPMLPLKIFHDRWFSLPVIVGASINFGFYGTLFLMPLFLEQDKQYSVFITGLAMLPLTGFMAFAPYWSGKLTSHIGPRLPMIIGLLIGALGFALLFLGIQHSFSYAFLGLGLATIGFGYAFAMPAATFATIRAAPKGRGGFASGARR